MGSGGRNNDKPKALCIFGSESGTAKRTIEKMAKTWKSKGVDIDDVQDGNTVAANANALTSLKEKYDVLVVSTSSFGEGDPPSNYNMFLLQLYRSAAAGDKPLAGMQHVVLGFGASVYETYQNTPRLTDKLLGECGSRRMISRVELDEGMEDEPDDTVQKMAKFEADVLKALQSLPDAAAPPVCDWKTPGSKILEKSEADLLMDAFEGGGLGKVAIAGVVAVAAAAAAYAYSVGLIEF